eukprot:Nk52_evm62s158 gene=Nk52_evmTU62s158
MSDSKKEPSYGAPQDPPQGAGQFAPPTAASVYPPSATGPPPPQSGYTAPPPAYPPPGMQQQGPPGAYPQGQGGPYPPAPPPQQVTTTIVTTGVGSMSGLSHRPQEVICPHCGHRGITRVEYEGGSCMWITAGTVCFITSFCALCCLAAIPLCMSDLKDANHYCTSCNSFIGKYEKTM